MKLNLEITSSYLLSKSMNISPKKENQFQILISQPKKNLLLPSPPQLYQQEKTQRKRTCLSPPPSLLFQSDPQSNNHNKLTSIKNPEKYHCLELTKKTSDGKPNLNKSFQPRPPPSFLLNGNKKNPLTGTLSKFSKEKATYHSKQKALFKEEDSWRRLSANPSFFSKMINHCKSQVSSIEKKSDHQNQKQKLEKEDPWRRLSANPSFFSKMINHCRSEVSSKEQKCLGESPGKPSGNSAASMNGRSEKSKTGNLMNVPSKPSNKTKSERNFNMKGSYSKVPSFIKNKECTKSQKQSSSNNSNKGVSLFQMMRSPEISSQDKSSVQDEDFSITINIKPAVQKKTIEDFFIIKELGEGSYGKACLAIDMQIGFICVLKIIDKEKLTEFETNNLLRQIKIQLFLNHHHLTGLYGYFGDEEKIYLVMELLPTGNLKDVKRNQSLPEKVVSHIVSQICSGISYMHNNHVLHRDLKPENIFTFDSYVKLGDFGCAVYSDITRNSFVGSPCYLSPEQLKNEFYDEKVDMWEIGTLTYELFFKKCPFQKDILEMMQGQRKLENLSELRFPALIQISEQAKNFIKRALDKDPSRRMSLDQALTHPFLKQKHVKVEIPNFIA